jgi:hypothetical protein
MLHAPAGRHAAEVSGDQMRIEVPGVVHRPPEVARPRRELGVEEGGLAVAGVGEGLIVAALAVERPVVREGEAVAGLEDPEEVVIRLMRVDRRRLSVGGMSFQ